MKTYRILLGLCAVISIWICGCRTPIKPASAWEYKVIEKGLYPGELQKQIDAAVDDGWEFLSVSTTVQESSIPHGFIIFRKLKR